MCVCVLVWYQGFLPIAYMYIHTYVYIYMYLSLDC